MQLFELFAKFTVDKQEFVKDMAEAEKTGQTTATKLSSSFDKLKKVLVGVVSVAAAKKAASAMMNVVAAAASVGDKIDKQSQALGMSRKAYQEWDYILAQSGASIDSLGVSMKTLNSAILEGSGDTADALKEIGLSAEGLADLSQEDAFGRVVEALQAMPAGAKKSALAMKLLGKNGQDLMPLLNSSSASIEELRKEAERLGMYMDDDGVDASVAYGDALDAMKRTFTGLKNTIATRVMPGMTNAFKVISDYAGNFHKNLKTAIETGDWAGLFENVWTDVKGAASDLWTRISDTVPELWNKLNEKANESESPVLQAVGALMESISAIISSITSEEGTLNRVLSTISETINGIKAEGIKVVSDVLSWIADPANADAVTLALEAVAAAFAALKIAEIVSSFSPLKMIIIGIAGAILLIGTYWDELKAAWEADKERITKVWENVKTAVNDAWEAVKQWFDANVLQTIETAWSGVTGFFENLWSAVKESVETAWEDVKTKVDSVFSRVQMTWLKIVTWFQTKIIDPVKKQWNDIKDGVDEVITDIKAAWEAIVNWFQENIIDPIVKAWEGFKNSFAGWIPGTKKATLEVDTVYNNAGTVWVDPETGAYGPAPAPEGGFNPNELTTEIGNGTDPWALFGNHTGSNAKGLGYVPYDDYFTRLHRGEMVLNKSRADDYRSGNNGGISTREIVAAVSAAVKEGLAQAELVMDKRVVGQVLTPEISRNMANGMTARRFATT